VIAFPPAALPAFIGTTRSSDSLLRFCLSHLLSLVRHTHFHVRQNRVSRVAVYSQSPTCHALRPRGGGCNSPFTLHTLLASELVSPSPYPVLCISRLNHFSLRLRPAGSFPLCLIFGISSADPEFTSRWLAKPYRGGSLTRQNKRPCPAALLTTA